MSSVRETLRSLHRAPEEEVAAALLKIAPLNAAERETAARMARGWVENVRTQTQSQGMLDFMQEFGLSTTEGIALMCVAEALLRIPDSATADDLIADKLGGVDWAKHAQKTDSFFAHASVWGLMLTGKLISWRQKDVDSALAGLAGRVSAPVVRTAVTRAMAMLGSQFVLGRTIGEALEEAHGLQRQGYRLSYDMLGEGARTREDADRYFESYRDALRKIASEKKSDDVWEAPGISVKLSALHPRFQESQRARCRGELTARLTTLCEDAAKAGIGLTVDAEESERLELTLDIFEDVLKSDVTREWPGLGLAVQAYQKRGQAVVEELLTVAKDNRRRLMIRLVKGAYWDSEVKRAQMGGYSEYPVFTRKSATDLNYFACAQRLFRASDTVYPAFGSHNAYTLAGLLVMAPARARFEFQRLYGMGVELHAEMVKHGHKSRIYAPVGHHRDLLAYLVRRILENGANSSFVHRVKDESVPIAALVHDPAEELRDFMVRRNSAIPLPPNIFWTEDRKNSSGLDLDSLAVSAAFLPEVRGLVKEWLPAPLIDGRPQPGTPRGMASPADAGHSNGLVVEATPDMVENALATAQKAQPHWAAMGPAARAAILDKAAELFEQHRAELVARLVREAGRCVRNAVAEVRETVDLCRYYAMLARKQLAPQLMPGYTGEANELTLHPRGIVAAISPWNFPLAIFTGQIAAALVTGNAVIAKSAAQTPAIGYRAVQLLHAAGVPASILAFMPGPGSTIGAKLVADPRVNAVVFTGSTEVGRTLNQTLANREGPIAPLIAETGGLNALIVDSTALAEQVTDDVLQSAFDSAGQRCSSLRVLFLQDDIADRMLEMIKGAAAELRVGDPMDLATDLGPVIDARAKKELEEHISRMEGEGKLLFRGTRPVEAARGHFIAPHIFEIESLSQLKREAFGPILHVIRWQRGRLGEVVAAIRNSGYGLTGGIHSRRDGFVKKLASELPVGNIYVNRNLIGAVPGVQPFGGEGLSGTGPKAGGPNYLSRFCVERHVSIDTTAAGGNASLLMMEH